MAMHLQECPTLNKGSYPLPGMSSIQEIVIWRIYVFFKQRKTVFFLLYAALNTTFKINIFYFAVPCETNKPNSPWRYLTPASPGQFRANFREWLQYVSTHGVEEQDKSSDNEQQPPFGDCKYSNTLHQTRGGGVKLR